MLSITPTVPAELEHAYVAWRLAADEAADALHAWIFGPTAAREAAFHGYRVALDREEHAAGILARHAH